MLTLASRMVNEFGACLTISYQHAFFLVSILGVAPNHTSLRYRCPFKVKHQIRFINLSKCCMTLPSQAFVDSFFVILLFQVWVLCLTMSSGLTYQ